MSVFPRGRIWWCKFYLGGTGNSRVVQIDLNTMPKIPRARCDVSPNKPTTRFRTGRKTGPEARPKRRWRTTRRLNLARLVSRFYAM
jgi:hypothetical protein